MMKTADLKPFVQRAGELGTADAKVVDPGSGVTAPWVRWEGGYGCGMYGGSLRCPPHTSTPAWTREVLDSYRRAVLIHCQAGVRVKELAVVLERELFLAGYYRAFGLGEGPCHLGKERLPRALAIAVPWPNPPRPKTLRVFGRNTLQTNRMPGTHLYSP